MQYRSVYFIEYSCIRITYNQRPPKYAYNNETNHSDGDTFEGAILKAYIGKKEIMLGKLQKNIWGTSKQDKFGEGVCGFIYGILFYC